jgi:hypothetical protein
MKNRSFFRVGFQEPCLVHVAAILLHCLGEMLYDSAAAVDYWGISSSYLWGCLGSLGFIIAPRFCCLLHMLLKTSAEERAEGTEAEDTALASAAKPYAESWRISGSRQWSGLMPSPDGSSREERSPPPASSETQSGSYALKHFFIVPLPHSGQRFEALELTS